ncbi:PilZ domain-containing protein [Methylicorpusculum sp.]|uniref:PilZ domain-containing protein n=1 Tax=Methylicorpusculum sp. TaxID=2713644 RepID=UPI002731A6F8|nr:PilZ domain-containing protein [Methylicorpusculum sp.]MDP2179955.1 PilZ domain-containing protein [Methylicorpusculum sp.]MDP3530394.1 PilZ domain-containing protein [Methylicorpusculum sp.]MDZ4154217.1 PilZ domain-containing protein [Methylicorpusculum sp.]
MNTMKVNGKKLNRRVAFRVYEQVNLYFHKVDSSQINEFRPEFDNSLALSPSDQSSTQITGQSEEQSLPNSQSRENDTLNVNISSSGIAFTCKEALNPGDYLVIRLFLLSSLTVIMTCCKVVYCKPSNPYEKNRYPHLVGAHFVNMTAEDSDLLEGYVARRKKQQMIANGLLLTLLMTILAVPDVLIDVFLDLCDQAIDLFMETLSIAYDYAGMSLDYIIERLFHTDRHQTQVIEFYTTIIFGLALLYGLWRHFPRFCAHLVNRLREFWFRKKASFRYFWGEQSLLNKVKIAVMGIIAVTCYGYFAI